MLTYKRIEEIEVSYVDRHDNNEATMSGQALSDISLLIRDNRELRQIIDKNKATLVLCHACRFLCSYEEDKGFFCIYFGIIKKIERPFQQGCTLGV